MNLQIIARELWEYDQVTRIEIWDFVAAIALLLLLITIAFIFVLKKLQNEQYYKFFMPGLITRLGGVLFFCLIYFFYFGGGDTTAYFESSMALANLFYQDPQKYFEVMTSTPSPEVRSLFSVRTGYPYSYMFYDSSTFLVVKLTSILTIITFKSYLLTSLLLGYLTYFGTWKLFILFRSYVPLIENKIAWAVLYFPSPLFWGGGISKDTYTYTATALFVYCAHEFFILKKRNLFLIAFLIFGAWIILSIKPYIFLVLFPGGVLWIFYNKLIKIKSPVVAFFLFPLVMVGVTILSYFVLSLLGSNMSKFALDKALETAAITNYDLKQDYYGGSSFNIGDFDGSVFGMFRLFFPALNAGLFRPYLWESKSIVLILAGMENAFLLFFTIYLLYKTKVRGALKIIAQNPLLLFCMTFSVLFAFMIGLTTSNFGALVRFKIPLIPFYLSSLFIIDYIWSKKKLNL